MKLSLVEFLFRAVAPVAQSLQSGSMVLCAADRNEDDGTTTELPIVVLKGEPDARLNPTEPGILVGVIETPDCPMLMFGLHLDDQTSGFPRAFTVTVPMHTAEQRSLMRILANARECLYVAISGPLPTLAIGTNITPSLHEILSTAWDAIAALPLNPEADIDRAREVADAVMQKVATEVEGGFFHAHGSTPPSCGSDLDASPPSN